MSLGARATKGGAKAGGKDGKHAQDKGKTTEKPQPKEKVKLQATSEQLRLANMIDCKSEDVIEIRRMVTELMEMTCRTEEEVCSALHDSDHDMVAACNLLLEESQRIQGEWQTSEKKKKKPPAPAGNGELDPPRDSRDSREPRDARSRSGPRPRRGEGEGGRGRGVGRGRGGARGGRGAGRGGRRGGTRPRPPRTDNDWHDNDVGANMGDSFPTTEDWDNEEWSGSLSDTKVFTPSVNAQNAVGETEPVTSQPATEDWDCPTETNGPTESHITTYTYHNTTQPHHHHSLLEQMGTGNSHATAGGAKPEATSADQQHYAHHHQPMGMSGSLSAAQSQYLSQLTQQSQRHDPSVYTSNYGVYGSTDITSQRKTQRARVPPPSKIPSSAVEMPGGGEASGTMFLDVQFGALEPEALHDTAPPPQHQAPQVQHQVQQVQHQHQPQPVQHQAQQVPPTVQHQPQPQHQPQTQHAQPTHAQTPKQMTSQPETQPVSASHETTSEAPSSSYPNTNSMLNESMSVVDTTPASQPVTSEPTVTNTTSLEKQLSASIKQLSVSGVASGVASGVVSGDSSAANVTPAPALHAPPHYAHHRPKTVGQQNVYPHHAVSHHPPVYGANVYAQQVNSTNASLTGASAMTATAYPSSVPLTQYQPIMNSYQTSASAGAYGGSALYTAAPYATYQPTPQPKPQAKETQQYDSSAASSNNSLTSTSTTQTSTAKLATTTVSGGAGVTNAGGASSGAGAAAGAGAGAGVGASYGGALYGAGYGYDEQLMRGALPHHMGGYYEAGYVAREGTFGLSGGERFGRTDAASPQQVPAALPPGYAYFYQPPPTTYQYGVYPTYGGNSSVGGVGGVGVSGAAKVSAYSQQQQPPYDAQDSYKPGGPYTANANKSAGGATADLTNAMYAKTHVALNKVNSYEKAGFHSGTPPPFGAGSHLYIAAPAHHHPHHHAPQQHQMDVRVNSSHNRRQESGAGGGRNATAKPASSKPTYSQSYWAPN